VPEKNFLAEAAPHQKQSPMGAPTEPDNNI